LYRDGGVGWNTIADVIERTTASIADIPQSGFQSDTIRIDNDVFQERIRYDTPLGNYVLEV